MEPENNKERVATSSRLLNFPRLLCLIGTCRWQLLHNVLRLRETEQFAAPSTMSPSLFPVCATQLNPVILSQLRGSKTLQISLMSSPPVPGSYLLQPVLAASESCPFSPGLLDLRFAARDLPEHRTRRESRFRLPSVDENCSSLAARTPRSYYVWDGYSLNSFTHKASPSFGNERASSVPSIPAGAMSMTLTTCSSLNSPSYHIYQEVSECHATFSAVKLPCLHSVHIPSALPASKTCKSMGGSGGGGADAQIIRAAQADALNLEHRKPHDEMTALPPHPARTHLAASGL